MINFNLDAGIFFEGHKQKTRKQKQKLKTKKTVKKQLLPRSTIRKC